MADENDDKTILRDFFYGIHVSLGGTGVDVELEDDDYNYAFAEALRVYRSMASKSVRMGYCFLELVPGQTTYDLPKTIETVIEIHRTKAGYLPGGAQFEPFSAAFIQQTLGSANGGFPGLVSYEIMMGYQELLQRMLGGHIMFEFRRSRNQLSLWYTPKDNEVIALHCSELKSPDELLNDQLVHQVLHKYTEGRCRVILGEKYSKGNVPGPQGGITLKGTDLKQEGKEMMEAAIQDVLDFVDGGYGSTAPFFG